jgi:hypothetical protein
MRSDGRLRLDLQQGDVAALVGAQHLGLEFAAVGQRDRHFVGASTTWALVIT